MPTDRDTAQRTDARTRLLRATARLLWARGYHGTSIAAILEESGVQKGSLYFHFPEGKDRLVLEALRMTAATVSDIMTNGLAQTRRPGDATRAIANALGARLDKSKFTRGCPVSTVMLESATISEEIRDACADTYEEWHGLMVGRLLENGATPERAGALATLVLSAVEGALILSRARRNMAPLKEVTEQVARMLQDEAARTVKRTGARPSHRKAPTHVR